LESEIRQVIADSKEDKVFACDEDGLWYSGVSKTNTGRLLANQQADRSSLEYMKKLESFMNSPPKKRGGGILPSQPASMKPTPEPTHIPAMVPKPSLYSAVASSNPSFIDKFGDIQLQFTKQQEQNALFHA